MTLSWNEIKDRALKFSQEWAEAANEDADAKYITSEFPMNSNTKRKELEYP